jgi:hypothetical protein
MSVTVKPVKPLYDINQYKIYDNAFLNVKCFGSILKFNLRFNEVS